MKLLNSIIHFWHRCVLAIIVEDVRRTESRFTSLDAEIESRLIHLRTSSQKNLAAEAHALHARINHIEARFKELEVGLRTELKAELMKHVEAVRWLSATKRDSQGSAGQ